MDSRQAGRKRFDDQIKLLVMGAFSVGKTSLIQRFINGNCEKGVPDNASDVEDYYRHSVEDCGEMVEVDILDTTGDLEYSQILKLAIRTGDIFVLVYAIDDKISFEKILDLRNLIIKERGKSENVSIIVVGNKIDRHPPARSPSKEAAEKVVKDWGYPYMEISTRDKDAVDNVFSEIVRRHRSGSTDFGKYTHRRMTSPIELMQTLRRRLAFKRSNSSI